ncbi:MAG TPA: alpha/beta hydrolase [Kofleriaceae bacterium]|nr:alpha/beta hydrolase [Kofleriaceae bacterium]
MTALQGWRAGGEPFAWRGHEIFARVDGTGAPLLLIHGFPTASYDWAPIVPALVGAGFQTITLDLIGFGFSAKPKSFDYSVMAYADLCAAFVAHRGISRLKVLAHDLGDTVAQELLARQRGGALPFTIERLCLLNGGLFPETHRARPVQKLLASRLGPLLAKRTTEARFAASMQRICARELAADETHAMWKLVTEHDGLAIMPALIRYMEERRVNRARWVGAIVDPQIPVRVIDGTDDPVSGAHMIARYRELVRDPDIVELDGVGHYPQVEAPARVSAPAIAFLTGAS